MAQQPDPRSTNSELTPKSFATDKYKVENHMYPNDLMSDGARIYGGNYVIFYINVADDSKLLNPTDGSLAEEVTDDIVVRDRGALLSESVLQGENGKAALVAGAVTGTALAGAAAGGALKFSEGIGKAISGGLKGAAVAAAPGAIGLGTAAAIASSTTRAQKRLKTAIALHVPNQLQIRYGMQWSEEDTATALMAPILGAAAMKAYKEGDSANLTGPGAAVIANLGLTKGPNAGTVSAATGLAANPRKEQVFKGVDFRTFQFEYQFFPRSSAEARNVEKIIRTFKLHMHPEYKDANKFLWIYPSEFDISYYNNGKENLHLHKHTSCVLTEMSVNYTPNAAFTTFADGMPTQINITLSFKELSLLDKEKIKIGL